MCFIKSSHSSNILSANMPVMPQMALTTGMGSARKCRHNPPAIGEIKAAMKHERTKRLQVIRLRNLLIEAPIAPIRINEPYLLKKSSIMFSLIMILGGQMCIFFFREPL